VKRGDIVTVALPGDLGKPRPALVMQSDLFPQTASVVLIPITSTITESMMRLTVQPSASNGLREASQLMTDRVSTVSRAKVGQVIGTLEAVYVREVSRRLSLFLALA
jgi:mRNA interferase MazF